MSTFRFPYRVVAPTADEAARQAKDTARDEGWVVRTVAKVEPQPNGQWVVTLAVVPRPKREEVPA